jgi:cation diffusion facilitator family transporter
MCGTHDVCAVGRAATPQAMASEKKKTVYVAMGANMVILAAKVVGGLISGSSALLAEAAHSLADTMNEVFLLVSLRLGSREPDETHPFGYGKERFFWAFMAALVIFVAGASFSVIQGLQVVLTGEDAAISNITVTYVILGVSFLAEGMSFARAYRQAAPASDDHFVQTLRRVRHSKDPTTKTILFEDGAAVTGVLIAVAGLVAYQLTGNVLWDGLASILIGCLLAYVAFALGRDVKGLLLGAAASPEVRDRLREVIAGYDEVDDVLELLTMHLAPEQLLVAVRIDLADDVTGRDVELVCDRIERALHDAEPMVTEVFLDPTPRYGAAHDRVSQQPQ